MERPRRIRSPTFMLVCVMGRMGAGKTLTMSLLAEFLRSKTGVPVFANYRLQNAKLIRELEAIWEMDSAVFCYDEIWIDMDARQYKNNIDLSRWINQTRKKKMIVFYTSQHIRQVEQRVRNATDILILCEKKQLKPVGPAAHILTFVDWQYKTIGRRYILENVQPFYSLYNTFEVIDPIKK